MKYQWELRFNDNDGEFYYQKLVNMSLPEVLSLDEAAERLNELEQQLKDAEIKSKALGQIEKMLRQSQVIPTTEYKLLRVIDEARQYLSQGFTPTETGMALNMSLEDVLKAKEQK